MSTIPLGAHVEQTDPIAEARARDTTVVQFFLGDPQSYKGPVVRYAGGPDGLKADAAAAGVDLYVHAPYLINVATTNNPSASLAASCSSSTWTPPPRSAPRG